VTVKPPDVQEQEEQARIAAANARRMEKNEKRQERKSAKHKREHSVSEEAASHSHVLMIMRLSQFHSNRCR
jgi:hypothetical protein